MPNSNKALMQKNAKRKKCGAKRFRWLQRLCVILPKTQCIVAKTRFLTVIATPGGKKQHVFKKNLIGPLVFVSGCKTT
jgi:hypothetical protein